ncbi:MAG: methionine adenosyltransferase, partial [Bifidobacterium crudilactis]|nr:methionine adenosyltransferase [Bifidobacterium crudilactis]
MPERRLISAESVTEGHPDKVCDQISDAILDDMLAQDPHSHVAVETSATTGQFFVFGEVSSQGYTDIQHKVRSVLRNIGYTSSEIG